MNRWTFVWRTEAGGDFHEQTFLVDDLIEAIRAWKKWWRLNPESCVFFDVKKEE
jgi:hypothetical protein